MQLLYMSRNHGNKDGEVIASLEIKQGKPVFRAIKEGLSESKLVPEKVDGLTAADGDQYLQALRRNICGSYLWTRLDENDELKKSYALSLGKKPDDVDVLGDLWQRIQQEKAISASDYDYSVEEVRKGYAKALEREGEIRKSLEKIAPAVKGVVEGDDYLNKSNSKDCLKWIELNAELSGIIQAKRILQEMGQ